MAIRPEFETVSSQHVVHAQQRSYSIHTESFSKKPHLSKWKELGSAGRVVTGTVEKKNIGVIYQLSQPLLFKNNFNLLVNKNLQGQCANFFPSNKVKYM